MASYRERTPLAARRREAERVRAAHPRRVPVLLVPASRECPRAEKDRFLVSLELTVAEFACAVRRHVELAPTQALFLHVDGLLAPGTAAMGALDARHRGDDGFLAVTYALENTFGGFSTRDSMEARMSSAVQPA